jgi:chorismate mutase
MAEVTNISSWLKQGESLLGGAEEELAGIDAQISQLTEKRLELVERVREVKVALGMEVPKKITRRRIRPLIRKVLKQAGGKELSFSEIQVLVAEEVGEEVLLDSVKRSVVRLAEGDSMVSVTDGGALYSKKVKTATRVAPSSSSANK